MQTNMCVCVCVKSSHHNVFSKVPPQFDLANPSSNSNCLSALVDGGQQILDLEENLYRVPSPLKRMTSITQPEDCDPSCPGGRSMDLRFTPPTSAED